VPKPKLVNCYFSAESFALVHGLEWCHSHLKSCHFQSALFLTDSQSALTPKSFFEIWDLFPSLFSCCVALSFQWVPSHAGHPENERADSLAKTGPTLLVTHVPCPLAPIIAKIRHTCSSLWKRNLSHNSLSCQIPSISSEELDLPRTFPVSSAVNYTDFAATVTAFFCPLIYAGSGLGAWPDCWISVEFLHALIPRKRSGSITTNPVHQILDSDPARAHLCHATCSFIIYQCINNKLCNLNQ